MFTCVCDTAVTLFVSSGYFTVAMDTVDIKRKLSVSSQGNGQKPETKRMKSGEFLPEQHLVEVDDAHAQEHAQPDMDDTGTGCIHERTSNLQLSETDSSNNRDLGNNEFTVSDTVEMASQEREDTIDVSDTVSMVSDYTDDEVDMFDESLCFRKDSGDSRKCLLLRRISDAILGTDDIDGPSSLECDGDDDHEMMNIVTYLQRKVEQETQTEIAKYLSSGSLEFATLSLDNIHHYYHVAACLHLKQLRDHCLSFCSQNNQTEILSKFIGCSCQKSIRRESASGYQRSHSVISNPDDTFPPQYFIVFTDNSAIEPEREKRKVTVKVIDMSEKMDVFNKEIRELKQFGEGFACCNCEVKESPFVFVSGGAGKGQQVQKYDVLLGKWSKCAKLVHGRSRHMMLTDGKNSVFAISGQEVPCIEEYDVKNNKWVDRASLLIHVISAAVILYQNKIYIFGGKTPAGPVASVQCYDVITRDVKRLGDLPCAFDGGKCVEFKGKIFIATYGGHMICYDPSNGQSFLCAQQPVQRRRFGMFVKNDRIYLVGGLLSLADSASEQRPQYRYNVEKDMWVEKYKMCDNFPVLASCVINYPQKCSVIPFNEGF